jgi:uncharacterized protein (DUF305 family)
MATAILPQAAGALAALFVLALPSVGSAAPPESAFQAENDVAMKRMMTDMGAPPTGNVDRDFATMMIAHHQGAIDMARAELHHGHNEQLRRIAQGIVVEQQQEIEAMRQAAASTPQAPAGGH